LELMNPRRRHRRRAAVKMITTVEIDHYRKMLDGWKNSKRNKRSSKH
jgi:hypothetical protein